MYDLLGELPGAMVMSEKENCPFSRKRPHWNYFLSLPRMDTVKEHSVIIDGCISVVNNMLMRELLRFPETYYIVSSTMLCCFIIWNHEHLPVVGPCST